MNFENFISGVYRNQFQYKSFLPSKINQEWTWDDPRINVLLENVTLSLGELTAFSRIVYKLLAIVPVKVTVVIRREADMRRDAKKIFQEIGQ